MELQESIGAFVDTGSSIALIFRRFLPKPLIIRYFQIFHAFFRHFVENLMSEMDSECVIRYERLRDDGCLLKISC